MDESVFTFLPPLLKPLTQDVTDIELRIYEEEGYSGLFEYIDTLEVSLRSSKSASAGKMLDLIKKMRAELEVVPSVFDVSEHESPKKDSKKEEELFREVDMLRQRVNELEDLGSSDDSNEMSVSREIEGLQIEFAERMRGLQSEYERRVEAVKQDLERGFDIERKLFENSLDKQASALDRMRLEAQSRDEEFKKVRLFL